MTVVAVDGAYLSPWLDGVVPLSQTPTRLLASGRADIEVLFVERVDDTTGRVLYPVDSDNLVVAPLAPGRYAVGAVCPAVLGADGRIASVYPPIDLGEGERLSVGEWTEDVVDMGVAVEGAVSDLKDLADQVVEQSALVTAHEGKLEAAEQQIAGIKDRQDETDGLVAGLGETVTSQGVSIADAVAQAQQAKEKADSAVTGSTLEFSVGTATTPGATWTETAPSVSGSQYLWQRTIVTYGSGDTVTLPAIRSTGLVGEKGVPGAPGEPGTPGAPGEPGAQGAQGDSVTSVTPYYRQVPATADPPELPTVATPPGWSTTEPAYTPDTALYRSEKVTYSNDTFQWTPVTKVESYAAAGQAISIANVSLEQLAHSLDDEPPEDPVEGAVWYPRNEQGDITGMWRWTGSEWATHATLTGLLLVPTEDGGQTLIGPDGVEATKLIAELLRVDLLYFDDAAGRTLVITDIPRENLAEDVGDALATAEELGSRIILDGASGTLTIARNRASSNDPVTAVQLSATSLDFVAADKLVAYIDSDLQQMSIANALITESFQVGAHLVRTIPGSGVTTFQQVSQVGG